MARSLRVTSFRAKPCFLAIDLALVNNFPLFKAQQRKQSVPRQAGDLATWQCALTSPHGTFRSDEARVLL